MTTEHAAGTGRPPALTLWRPWSELVLTRACTITEGTLVRTKALKPVENRGWQTTYRGPLVIHGGKRYDPDAVHLTRRLFPDLAGYIEQPDLTEQAPSGFLGVVDFFGICHGGVNPNHRCWCGGFAMPGQHHWLFQNPRRFPEPIPGNGAQGLFSHYPDAVVEAVAAALAVSAALVPAASD